MLILSPVMLTLCIAYFIDRKPLRLVPLDGVREARPWQTEYG